MMKDLNLTENTEGGILGYFLSKRFVTLSLIFGVFTFCDEIKAQVSLNCTGTATVTNTSNAFTNDGRVVLSGMNGRFNAWMTNPLGQEMSFASWDDLGGQTRTFTGLMPGTYTLTQERYDLGSNALLCSSSTSFTVGSSSLPTCSTTEIGGAVFHDFNANGTRDNSDVGEAGITVQAFNTSNTQVAIATSGANGNYKLTGLTAGQAYRLEFSWADSYLKSGAIGSSSSSSIQFVSAGTCNANFSVNLPTNYCQNSNPYLVTPCFVNGNPTSAAVSPMDAMVAYPYNASTSYDVSTQNPAVTHVATVGQVGALWSVAYQKTTKFMFSGATMRRYAGFGPLGTGGIYRINMANPTAPTVANWVDVRTIGIPTGTDTRDGSTANSLSNSPGSPAWDVQAYNNVGKIGIGGMDFNERGDTLWLINLADKKLYGIRNVNPSVTPTSAQVVGGYSVVLPSGFSCASGAGDFRPWGVKFYKGLVYVTAMCTGESTPWQNQNLRGFVLSFDPKNPTAGFSVAGSFPLDYTRRNYNTSTNNFQTWTNTSYYSNYIIQPIVTDLEFDVDGSMIVGIADRGGLQMGNQNYAANTSDYSLNDANSYGDVIKLCKVGNSYVTEGASGCSFPTNPFGTSEFYWGDHGPFSGKTNDFMEAGAGGLVYVPGNGAFLTNAHDPSWWHAGGTIAISPISGGDVRRYTVYDASVPGAQGKATGLGDLEALCDPAPIEIGNRIWVDADKDGLQEAGESGIGGVTLRLYNVATNTLVATTTSNASGIYKFTNLSPNTQYRIEINENDAALSVKKTTNSNIGSNDLIDSDGSKVGSIISITLTTGWYGDNNHSYDFGFEACSGLTSPGSIGTDQSVCGNSLDPSVLTELTAPTGGSGTLEYQWQISTNNSTWTDISGATAQTYDPPTITATRYYRRGVRRSGCDGYLYTNTATATVGAVPATPTAMSASRCGSGTITLTASGCAGGTIYWYNQAGTTQLGSGASFTTPSLSATTTYSVFCQVNGCWSAAATATATINQTPAAPTGNDVARCGAGTVTLTATGCAGGTIYWYDQAGATYLGTGSSFTTPSLSTTTTYSVWCQTNGCWSQADYATATINTAPVGGTVSPANQTICAGAGVVPTTHTLAGHSGTIVRWEWQAPGSSTWNNWGGAGSTTAPGNCCFTSIGTWKVRAILGSGVCPEAASSEANIVVVSDPSVSVSGGGITICNGGTATLTANVTGGTGTTNFQWQSSPDGITWTNISGATTATYTTAALSATTQYRVNITQTGTNCDAASSSSVTVSVVADPSVNIAATSSGVCVGGNVTLNATTSGGTGTCAIQWQSFDGTTWTNISGATGNSYITPTLSTQTRYRAQVNCSGNGCCN
jgi:hypothetical protein